MSRRSQWTQRNGRAELDDFLLGYTRTTLRRACSQTKHQEDLGPALVVWLNRQGRWDTLSDEQVEGLWDAQRLQSDRSLCGLLLKDVFQLNAKQYKDVRAAFENSALPGLTGIYKANDEVGGYAIVVELPTAVATDPSIQTAGYAALAALAASSVVGGVAKTVYNRKVKAYETELSTSKSSEKVSKDVLASAQLKLSELAESQAEKEAQNSSMKTENERLISEGQTRETELTRVLSELATVMEQRAELREETRMQARDIERQSVELNKSKELVKQIQLQNHQLEDRRNALTMRIPELEQRDKEQTTEVARLNAESKGQRLQMEKTQGELAQCKQDNKSQMNQKDEEIQSMRAANKRRLLEKQELETRHTELVQQRQRAESTITENAAEIQKLTQEASQMRDQFESEKQRLSEKNVAQVMEIAQHEQQHASQIAQKDEQIQRLQETQQSIEAVNQELSTALQETKTSVKQQTLEIQGYQERTQSLEGTVQQLSQQNTELNDQNVQQLHMVEERQSKMEALQTEVDGVREEFELYKTESQGQKDAFRTELRHFEETRLVTGDDLRRLQSTVDKLSAEYRQVLENFTAILLENERLQTMLTASRPNRSQSRDQKETVGSSLPRLEGIQTPQSFVGQSPQDPLPDFGTTAQALAKLVNYRAFNSKICELIAAWVLSRSDVQLIQEMEESQQLQFILRLLRDKYQRQIDDLSKDPAYNHFVFRRMALELAAQKGRMIRREFEFQSDVIPMYNFFIDTLNKKADEGLQREGPHDEQKIDISEPEAIVPFELDASKLRVQPRQISKVKEDEEVSNVDLSDDIIRFMGQLPCGNKQALNGSLEQHQHNVCVALKGGTYSDGTVQDGINEQLKSNIISVTKSINALNFPLSEQSVEDIKKLFDDPAHSEKLLGTLILNIKQQWRVVNKFKPRFLSAVFPNPRSEPFANHTTLELYKFYNKLHQSDSSSDEE
jgi:hypothetical protein